MDFKVGQCASGLASEYVLALDTCGAETTLALAHTQDGKLTVIREEVLGARTAGARLTGALGNLLGEIMPAALRAMIVVRGPGSFTGMRIGLSAAKAFSEVTGVPLIGLSRLQVMRGMYLAQSVALDAGRGHVYLRMHGGDEDTSEGQLLTVAEVQRVLAIGKNGALIVCEDRVQESFPEARRVPAPTAADALRHGHARLQTGDWDDAATLDGLYLWRAEQMLGVPASSA